MMDKPNTINALKEFPTWLVIIAVYLLWFLVLLNYHTLPFAGLFLVLILGFHGSVQHELLHGHPTNNQTINDVLAYAPLALWYPYPIYKNTHLKHHENANLTLPGVDPESYFIDKADWQKMSKPSRLIAMVNMTLIGRLLFAPFWHFVNLKKQMIRSVMGADVDRNTWLFHEFLCGLLLLIVYWFFDVNILIYIACSYFAQSCTLLRSYYEHRVEDDPLHRTVIMQASLPLRLFFLNNNYHAVHHQHPDMSWFELSSEYYSKSDYYNEQNGHFIERGYWQWFIKHAFRPVASPAHPGFVKNER